MLVLVPAARSSSSSTGNAGHVLANVTLPQLTVRSIGTANNSIVIATISQSVLRVHQYVPSTGSSTSLDFGAIASQANITATSFTTNSMQVLAHTQAAQGTVQATVFTSSGSWSLPTPANTTAARTLSFWQSTTSASQDVTVIARQLTVAGQTMCVLQGVHAGQLLWERRILDQVPLVPGQQPGRIVACSAAAPLYINGAQWRAPHAIVFAISYQQATTLLYVSATGSALAAQSTPAIDVDMTALHFAVSYLTCSIVLPASLGVRVLKMPAAVWPAGSNICADVTPAEQHNGSVIATPAHAAAYPVGAYAGRQILVTSVQGGAGLLDTDGSAALLSWSPEWQALALAGTAGASACNSEAATPEACNAIGLQGSSVVGAQPDSVPLNPAWKLRIPAGQTLLSRPITLPSTRVTGVVAVATRSTSQDIVLLVQADEPAPSPGPPNPPGPGGNEPSGPALSTGAWLAIAMSVAVVLGAGTAWVVTRRRDARAATAASRGSYAELDAYMQL